MRFAEDSLEMMEEEEEEEIEMVVRKKMAHNNVSFKLFLDFVFNSRHLSFAAIIPHNCFFRMSFFFPFELFVPGFFFSLGKAICLLSSPTLHDLVVNKGV